MSELRRLGLAPPRDGLSFLELVVIASLSEREW
jgi:hypothetical protein